MEDPDKKLKDKLESIKKIFDERYKNSLKNINEKINGLKKYISDNKKLNENNRLNIIPKIRLIPSMDNPNELLNYFINVILFIFANLEITNELCLGEEYKEILKKLPQNGEKCFTNLFIDLVNNMKIKNGNIDYQPIHNYLKNELKENYLNQNPKFLIRKFLIMIENDINKVNLLKNIITDNFCFVLKKIKTCNKCKLNILISEEKKISVDLFLKKSVSIKDMPKELKSNLKNLLLEKLDMKLFCPKCNENMDAYMKIEEPKKYLIFNLNKDEKIKNTMKLIYSNNINLTEEKDGKKYKYEYELISALANKKIKINDKDIIDINEQNKYILFMKNYINNKWYKYVNGKQKDIIGNIQEEINSKNPNILIYKQKSIKFGF